MNPLRSMLDRKPREMSNGWTKESEIIVVVEDFSYLLFGLKRAACIKSVSAEIPEITINITRSGESQLLFNLIFVNGGARLFSCKVLILGNTGFWHECGQVDVMKTCNVWCEFPLTVNLETRTYKQYFLQNDEITLKCKVTYFELTLPENSATIGHGLDSPQSLQTSPCVENLPLSEN
ncbi:hypothetical protein AVEN_35939-1 [Araneus ventricosus]|uniref:Uncharacterized protein n=1 Tax=Araneus ventricosus TaxID=182803 RepID=A0A4Y2QBE2_ARAVE|nr:hypothetical protein AVEN_35939-1 [Araneus ventricosus]